MKAEYINPFMQGAQNVLSTACGEQTRLGKVYLKTPPYQEQVAVIVGIIGQLKGSVVFTMSPMLGCKLASQMMMGMPVTQMDDMALSAVSELANMISGNIATLFAGVGKLIDITPPTAFLDAAAYNKAVPFQKLMVLPLALKSNEVFEINVWVEEA